MQSDSRDNKISLAQDHKTSPEILTELSRDEDWNIRYYVAGNPAVPPEILWCLLRDEVDTVRRYVCINKSITPDMIQAVLLDHKLHDTMMLVLINQHRSNRS